MVRLQCFNYTQPSSNPIRVSEVAVKPLSHSILQLQVASGNRATNQVIAAHPQPIQRKVLFSGLSQELAQDLQLQRESLLVPKAGGKKLPEPVQQKMEGAFGTDFSDVRIHEGREAEVIGATAYTSGSHIHFAPGKYAPTSPSGQQLLGHELAHVMQQKAGRVATPQGNNLPINDSPSLEAEADALGAKAAQAEPAQLQGSAIQPRRASNPKTVVQCWRPFKEARYKLGRNYGIVFGKSGLRGDQERRAARRETNSRVNIIPPEETETIPDKFTEAELQTHMKAYKSARYYHVTKKATVDLILRGGLDPNFGGKGGADAEQAQTGNPNRVYVGGDATTSRFYKGVLNKHDPQVLRPFLTPDQVESLREDSDDADNLAYWTDQAISSSYIVHGKLGSQEDAKLRAIFEVVRQHYPPAKQEISTEEVMERHFEAIRRGFTKHKEREVAEKPGNGYYQFPDSGYESD